jgi:phosphonopyruvate decarboxylase
MSREQAVQAIAGSLGERDFVVSTTGQLSRELYEFRQNTNQSGGHDFLTVGSMGHAASIALGIAERKPDRRIWCLDGDGALIMHMGCMALIGSRNPSNLVHVLLNNCAHESVGGMPTVAASIDFPAIARACGYPASKTVSTIGELESALAEIRDMAGLVFLQVNVNLDCRTDLGRPKSTPVENKKEFTRLLRLPKEKAC